MHSFLQNQNCFFLSLSLLSAGSLFYCCSHTFTQHCNQTQWQLDFWSTSGNPRRTWDHTWHHPVLLCQGIFDQKFHTAAAISAISHLVISKLSLKIFHCSTSHSKQFSEKARILFSANSIDFSCAKNGAVQYFTAISILLEHSFACFCL